jgi:methyltransferase (TIGR00027 family)
MGWAPARMQLLGSRRLEVLRTARLPFAPGKEDCMTDAALPDISDTARWVAVYRALESERPDALFRDPFASQLAGERGREIARSLWKSVRRNSWPLVMRTFVIDQLVLKSVAEGADRVLNLATGLDTRPYRLALPPGLLWVEADLPGILKEKERALSDAKPVCVLRREPVDLTDAAQRSAFLLRALQGSQRALVITEGLLVYLPEAEVRTLAAELAHQSAIAWWMVDLASPGLLKMMQRRTSSRLGPSAQMQFGPADGIRFFEALGWKPLEVFSLFREAARNRRLPALLRLFAWLPDADPTNPGKRPWGGVVRYAREASRTTAT